MVLLRIPADPVLVAEREPPYVECTAGVNSALDLRRPKKSMVARAGPKSTISRKRPLSTLCYIASSRSRQGPAAGDLRDDAHLAIEIDGSEQRMLEDEDVTAALDLETIRETLLTICEAVEMIFCR